MTSWGTQLRRARERRNLTQAELAARLGVDQSTVSYHESGEHAITDAVIHRTAEALGYRAVLVLQPVRAKRDRAAEARPEVVRVTKERLGHGPANAGDVYLHCADWRKLYHDVTLTDVLAALHALRSSGEARRDRAGVWRLVGPNKRNRPRQP